MREVDPITAEVVRCGLETIANEMGDTMIRTATTPTERHANDKADRQRMLTSSY